MARQVRFNVAAGSLATMVGSGAALSTTIGGVLIQHLGYQALFLGLSAIALLAFAVLWFAIPETLCDADSNTTAGPEIKTTTSWAPQLGSTKSGRIR